MFTAAVASQDDQYKYRYIYKGAPGTRGKKLFYVYGIGMKSKDARSKVTKQYKPKGKGYIWPSSFRNPAHFYYELVFKEQGIWFFFSCFLVLNTNVNYAALSETLGIIIFLYKIIHLLNLYSKLAISTCFNNFAHGFIDLCVFDLTLKLSTKLYKFHVGNYSHILCVSLSFKLRRQLI